MSRWPRLLLTPALALLTGCSLTKPESDSAAGSSAGALARLGVSSDTIGQLIAPKRNALKVMIAARPVDDPVLGDGLWQIVDEQALDSETRLQLEANGIRVGIIDGHLPAAVEELLDPDKPAPERIDPVVIERPDGAATPITVGPDTPANRVTLFLSQKGAATGRDYELARGAFRVTANQELGDQARVKLRIVPEIHHGPVQRRVTADDNPGPFDPQQFIYHDGQEEESFRDLAANIALEPNQILILGCWPQKTGSLGHFLLTQMEPNSDRLVQKVIFVWARPTSGNSIPWVEPITPPSSLQPIDPDELDTPRLKNR